MNRPYHIAGGCVLLAAVLLLAGCGNLRKLEESDPKTPLNLPRHASQDIEAAKNAQRRQIEPTKEIHYTNIDGTTRVFIPTENVIIDTTTNEQMWALNIDAVEILARSSRNLVERNGKINVEFIVSVPDTLLARDWQLVLNPWIREGQHGEAHPLDPLVYRGDRYGRMQEREYDRYDKAHEGLVQDLRRYVRSTDNRVARRVTYVPDPDNKFDHLRDYLTPRYRFDSVNVLPGGEVYTRVDGHYPAEGGRAREDYLQSLAEQPQKVATQVRGADAEQVRRMASQRVDWTNRRRTKVYDMLRETDTCVINENLTQSRYYVAPNTAGDVFATAEERELARQEGDKGSVVYKRIVRHPVFPNARLDTVILRPDHRIDFYYSQQVEANENTDKLYLYLSGGVENRRGRHYEMRHSDTLNFSVKSMISFLDERTRYMHRIVLRDAEANARFYFTFPSGRAKLDTTAENRAQVRAVRNLTRDLMLDPIYIIDSISLRATSSPEGSWRINDRLARERAEALRSVLVEEFRPLYDSLRNEAVKAYVTLDEEGKQVVVEGEEEEKLPDLPNLLRSEWLAEDWDELARLVRADTAMTDKEEVLAMIADRETAPDAREYRIRLKYPKAYAHMRRNIYPQMRAVDFRFNLHRRGQKQDTVYTTEVDQRYMDALELLKKRRYEEALNTLRDYDDRNTAIAYMSLGYNKAAYRVLMAQPNVDWTAEEQYLLAIIAARLGDEQEAVQHFLRACELRSNLKFRGNLDPELSYLIRKYGLDQQDFQDNY